MKPSAGSQLSFLCHIPETGKQSLDPLNLPSVCTGPPDQFFSGWSNMDRKLQSSVEMGECQDIVHLCLKMWQTTKQETLTTWIPNPTAFIGMEFYQPLQETRIPQAQWGKALFLLDLRFLSLSWVKGTWIGSREPQRGHNHNYLCRAEDPRLKWLWTVTQRNNWRNSKCYQRQVAKVWSSCAQPTTHTEALGTQPWGRYHALWTRDGPRNHTACICIPAPLLTVDKATLDKWLNLSGPRFLLIQNYTHVSWH